jgi:hypothetical protein
MGTHPVRRQGVVAMLTLVMNVMTGLIAAMTLASLLHSALAFGHAFRRLHAQVERTQADESIRVTFRDIGEPLPRPAAHRPMVGAEAAVHPTWLTPQALSDCGAAA